MAVRYKAWVCSRPFIGIEGSNPAKDMDACQLRVLCAVR